MDMDQPIGTELVVPASARFCNLRLMNNLYLEAPNAISSMASNFSLFSGCCFKKVCNSGMAYVKN